MRKIALLFLAFMACRTPDYITSSVRYNGGVNGCDTVVNDPAHWYITKRAVLYEHLATRNLHEFLIIHRSGDYMVISGDSLVYEMTIQGDTIRLDRPDKYTKFHILWKQ